MVTSLSITKKKICKQILIVSIYTQSYLEWSRLKEWNGQKVTTFANWKTKTEVNIVGKK